MEEYFKEFYGDELIKELTQKRENSSYLKSLMSLEDSLR